MINFNKRVFISSTKRVADISLVCQHQIKFPWKTKNTFCEHCIEIIDHIISVFSYASCEQMHRFLPPIGGSGLPSVFTKQNLSESGPEIRIENSIYDRI